MSARADGARPEEEEGVFTRVHRVSVAGIVGGEGVPPGLAVWIARRGSAPESARRASLRGRRFFFALDLAPGDHEARLGTREGEPIAAAAFTVPARRGRKDAPYVRCDIGREEDDTDGR